jgi:hypothetical protein
MFEIEENPMYSGIGMMTFAEVIVGQKLAILIVTG